VKRPGRNAKKYILKNYPCIPRGKNFGRVTYSQDGKKGKAKKVKGKKTRFHLDAKK